MRVRRALAPVLVLLRAQPRVAARPSPGSRTSAPTWSGSPTPSGCVRTSASTPRCRALRWDGGGAALGGRDRRRAADRRCRRVRDRAALRPEDPRHPGAGHLPRQGLPLRPLGPRLRPARQARRHGRHRRLGDPDRARHPAGRASGSRSSSAPRPGCCRASTARSAAPRRWLHTQAARRPGPRAAGCCGASGSCRSAPSPSARTSWASSSGWPGAHMRRAIKDPALRAKLTPDYRIGCKRILLSNDLLPGARPAQCGRGRRRAERGPRHHARRPPTAARPRSTRSSSAPASTSPTCRSPSGSPAPTGTTLAEEWKDGMEALRGATAAGFPNFLTIIGPNTGLGNSSMILMIESQLNYMADYLRQLDVLGGQGRAGRPAVAPCSAWNRRIQERMKRTVWNTGGCDSWYLDANGRNTTVWPGTTAEFRRVTRQVDLAEYEVLRPPTGRPAATRSAGTHGGGGPREPPPARHHRPVRPAACRARADRRLRRRRPAARRGARARGRARRRPRPRLDLLDRLLGRRSSANWPPTTGSIVYDQRGHGRSPAAGPAATAPTRSPTTWRPCWSATLAPGRDGPWSAGTPWAA